MRFLTDENVATSVMLALRESNHDVIDVKEQNWNGAADHILVEHASRKKRIIVTHDKDFLLQHKVSVILLRFKNQNPKMVKHYLLDYLNNKFLLKALKRKTLAVLSETAFELHELK